MLVSVIIPVYRDRARLVECLRRLSRQSLASDAFEVIVANNAPDEALELPSFNYSLKVVQCAQPGSYAARNEGARRSSGNLLAFTDADCLPEEDWLKNLVQAAQDNPDAALFSGRVDVFPADSGTVGWIEAYDVAVGINQELYFRKGVAATANLAVRRAAFEHLDGFDAGRKSGGDTDFCVRAKQRNLLLLYRDDAVVRHPARSSWRDIITKARRIVGGRTQTSGLARLRNAVVILAPPLIRIMIIIRHSSLSPKNKAKALATTLVIKAVQIAELFRLLVLRKARVR